MVCIIEDLPIWEDVLKFIQEHENSLSSKYVEGYFYWAWVGFCLRLSKLSQRSVDTWATLDMGYHATYNYMYTFLVHIYFIYRVYLPLHIICYLIFRACVHQQINFFGANGIIFAHTLRLPPSLSDNFVNVLIEIFNLSSAEFINCLKLN